LGTAGHSIARGSQSKVEGPIKARGNDIFSLPLLQKHHGNPLFGIDNNVCSAGAGARASIYRAIDNTSSWRRFLVLDGMTTNLVSNQ
jgi:hypothetical protein